jgi:hypothetical protein
MAARPPGGEYQTAPAVQIGWWLWLGTHWEKITGKRIDGPNVYYTAGGRVYRVDSLEAVMIRRTVPPELTLPGPAAERPALRLSQSRPIPLLHQ